MNYSRRFLCPLQPRSFARCTKTAKSLPCRRAFASADESREKKLTELRGDNSQGDPMHTMDRKFLNSDPNDVYKITQIDRSGDFYEVILTCFLLSPFQ